jgi:hypothetical protein
LCQHDVSGAAPQVIRGAVAELDDEPGRPPSAEEMAEPRTNGGQIQPPSITYNAPPLAG